MDSDELVMCSDVGSWAMMEDDMLAVMGNDGHMMRDVEHDGGWCAVGG